MLYFLLFFLGAAFGSFANALVWRTHEGKPVAWARSHCPACGAMIQWRDNVPIASFLILRGHCRSCHASIPPAYLMAEVAAGVLFIFFGLVHGVASQGITGFFIRDAVVAIILLTVFLYDYCYGEILDRFSTVPAIVLFFLSLFFGWQSAGGMALGAAFGAGFFLLQILVSRGRWVGGGDVRLGFFMGVILGFSKVLVALFGAYAAGAVVSLFLVATKQKQFSDATPFGTYLTLATVASMAYGDAVLQWYRGFLF